MTELDDETEKAMVEEHGFRMGDLNLKGQETQGHLRDDPSTPENEAWEGGVSPKKKTKKKAKT